MDRVRIAERAEQAQALLDNPLLKEAFVALKERYYSSLIQAEVGTLTASTAHASMKVLEDVQNQLKSVINDDKLASRNPRR